MSDAAAVLALDEARFDAQVAGDKGRLEELLAEELHYTHSNALVDTKASYIDSIISGRVRYRQIDGSGQNATVSGLMKSTVSGGTEVAVSGLKIGITGDTQVDLAAPMTNLGQTMTTVKGQLVKVEGTLIQLG